MTLPEYSPEVYALLRSFQSDGHYQPSTEEERVTLRYLRDEKLVIGYMEPQGRILSGKGVEALRQEDGRLAAAKEAAKDAKEQSQREAEEKAEEKSRSWWQFGLGLFLGWLLGCITPGDVIDFFVGLFH